MPNPSSPLAIVPTKESGGRSGSFGLDTAATFGTAAGATAGGGGRRDDEKIGRSRVPDNAVRGMAHNGLALSARSGTGVGAGGAVTTCTCAGAAGCAQMAGAAGDPARASSASLTSSGSATASEVKAAAY